MRPKHTHTPHLIGNQRRQQAFTLIELLASIAIIAILIAVILPAIAHVRERGDRVACVSNIRALLTATLQEASFKNGVLPELHQSTYNNPYWFDADNLESFRDTYQLSVDTFYSSSNPDWDAETFWEYSETAKVAGYLYMGNDNNWANSAVLSEKISEELTPFAKRVTDESAYQHLWVDLTRQMGGEWGTGVTHHDASGEPTGSHAGFRDGHVEWIPWEELSERHMQIGGIKMWF